MAMACTLTLKKLLSTSLPIRPATSHAFRSFFTSGAGFSRYADDVDYDGFVFYRPGFSSVTQGRKTRNSPDCHVDYDDDNGFRSFTGFRPSFSSVTQGRNSPDCHVDYEDDDGFRGFVAFRPSFSSGTAPDCHVDYEGLLPQPPSHSSARYGDYEDHKVFGWDFAFTKEHLNLQFAMAGFGKDDVKVTINKDTLIIKGKEVEYDARVELPEDVLKLDEVKAEMKNGMLTVVIPRLKDEENADVVEVKVE